MEVTFLYFVELTLFITGMLPYKMLKCDRTWYAILRHTLYVIYILIVMLFYLEIPSIWNNKEQFIESMNVMITYTVLVLKIYICTSSRFASLICEMVDTEKNVIDWGDENVLDIYKKCITRGKYIQWYNVYFSIFGFIVFFIPYFVKNIILWHLTEHDETEQRKFPFYLWMPFDENKHYATAFAVNFYFGVTTIAYYFTVQGLIIILLLHISFRLKVLGYLLKNIKLYAKNLGESEDNGRRVEGVVKFCVLEHLKIIKLTNTLNQCLRGVTMLEFIVLSGQIALILFEGVTSQSSYVIAVSVAHILLLFMQMLILYWHADDIREESVAISEALYETDWFEYSTNVGKTIQIMMIRSQRPLSLTIGPFGEMSLTVALKILKGAYTYMTFLEHVYGHKNT